MSSYCSLDGGLPIFLIIDLAKRQLRRLAVEDPLFLGRIRVLKEGCSVRGEKSDRLRNILKGEFITDKRHRDLVVSKWRRGNGFCQSLHSLRHSACPRVDVRKTHAFVMTIRALVLSLSTK